MPVDYILSLLLDGPENTAGWPLIKQYAPPLALAFAAKWYFGGTPNQWDRDVNGKVYMVTGGTSGLGAQVAYELALKGAQIIFLVRDPSSPWTVQFVEDLRERSNNFMIYAEQCDLADLHLIRLFATKWLDNTPPRRLDGVICCAAECLPVGAPREATANGIELQTGVNYVGHYHLLTLLAPLLRVQPPDRDVRVVVALCATQALGTIDEGDLFYTDKPYPLRQPWMVYGTLKLLLGVFCQEFQRQLDAYERKDKTPCNVKVNLVNPGVMRSALTRRFILMGTILGLVFYLVLYPVWWFFLKLASQGAQLFLFAIQAPFLRQTDGGQLVQECKLVQKRRAEYDDAELQARVFSATAKFIDDREREAARKRPKEKKKVDMLKAPATEADLMDKIGELRKSIGMPAAASASRDLPLFPEASDLTARAKKN